MIQMLTTHLWQSTFLALTVGLLTVAFRKNRAQVRYWLWLSASLKFFIPFALLLNLGSRLETLIPAARQITTPAVSYTIEQFSEPFFPESLPSPAPAPDTIQWIPIAILAVWLCGFATVAMIRSRNWRRIREAVRASSATNISATVAVRVSPGLLEPGVVGLWRPILLLPEGITEHLTSAELSAVLAHELCHIRRRDNLFAAIHMIVETIFWFHPLVWWIGARLVEEREQACDEEVLSQGNHPDVYADAILNVCKLYVECPLACVSGVSGAGVGRRIETIMSNRKLQGLNRAKKLLLASAGMAALAGPIALGLLIGVGNPSPIHAQSSVRSQPAQSQPTPAPKPKFDVASVRRCLPGDEVNGPPGGRGGGGGRGPRESPGRLRMQCLALDDIVNFAYIDSPQTRLLNNSSGPGNYAWLRNGPAWIHSDWYTIDAETEDPVANGPTGPGTVEAIGVMKKMLQVVLEDRFQLKMHHDTEEVPMYSLTVAKSGLKMKPMEEGGCIPHDPTKGVMTSQMFPPGQTPLCISWGHTNGPDWVIDAAGQRLSNLAGSLSGLLDRHVLDKTGVSDLFIYHLQFAHDETTPGPAARIATMFPPTDIPPGPSIFTVLDRLGLKLEQTTGPREYVVIDHIERPSEN